MLLEVRSAFRNGSKQLTWLDQATKDAVEDKVLSLPIISVDLMETSLEISLIMCICGVGGTSGETTRMNNVHL